MNMDAQEIRRAIEEGTKELAEMIRRREKPERIYGKRGELDGLYARLEEEKRNDRMH